MKLTIKDIKGNAQGELDVQFPVIEDCSGTQAVHDVVTAYRAAQRMGTACTKTMGEVAGTGKKPWRQKGTGRARAGSFASPIWRGGGVVFGPKPRDFTKKVSRNTRQLALRKALSERLRAGDVVVIDDLKLPSGKTKEFTAVLATLGVDGGTTLLVLDTAEKNVKLATRNVANVFVAACETVHTYEILRSDKLVFTRGAFEKVQARLNKE
jgi:large subunit ribosomal protein L4